MSAALNDAAGDVSDERSETATAQGATPDAPASAGNEVDSASALVGTLVEERYRILRLIGTGGMGAVYLAEHVLMHKQVALKVLHREMTALPEVVNRFEREAIAAARIEHPNVVQARDFGRVNGAFYLVLDYVEGDSLADLLERELFPVERALSVAGQIAEALVAAHAQGIVHRDLKPENVMLVPCPGQPELVKVLDFGIAKVSTRERGNPDRPITRSGAVFGTPEYMSPEQAAGQTVDERTDLYTLGILLYRMLSGQVPFSGDEINAVLMMQITQLPPALPEHVPQHVAQLVFALLEKSPDKRPQSAAEVVGAVLALLPSETAASHGRTRARLASSGTQPEERRSWFEKLDASRVGHRWQLGSGAIPAWRFVAGAASTMLLGAGLALWGWGRPSGAGAGSAPPPLVAETASAAASVASSSWTSNPEIDKLIGQVFAGDETAVAALEQRGAATRGVREWLALGSGYSKLRRHADAMLAYREAVLREATLGSDPALIRDTWEAMRDPAAAETAVRLAAEHLGKRGADLLYRVWVDTREVTPVTRLARELVYSKPVRDNASPALTFLLSWREATHCDQFRALLPAAALNADARALTLLQRAARTNDCTLPPEALQAALIAAKQRPEPAPF